MPDVTFRRLQAADLQPFRALRLRALVEFADHYTSTHEEESAEPESFHHAMIEQHLAYGAFENGILIATAVAKRPPMKKQQHKCMLSAVYVVTDHQRRGIGKELLKALLVEAAQEYEQMVIAVDTKNIAGIKLYESLGFAAFGMEPRALKEGDRYLDDLWLMKNL